MNLLINILLAYTLSFIFGFSYRFILKKFAPKKIQKNASMNIGLSDRYIRYVIAIILAIAGLFEQKFIFFFFSGFSLFEALFSWCGFYAAIGKNTCPFK